MKLYMIDPLGPFFLDYKKKIINWSKIPFENLEIDGSFDTHKALRILDELETFLTKVKSLGFNAISLDELSHFVTMPFYEEDLQNKLKDYQRFYERIIFLAKRYEFKVFVRTDVIPENKAIKKFVGKSFLRKGIFMQDLIRNLFISYPLADGVILRIGESDGQDITGDFRSGLTIKKPEELRALIVGLLPIFETLKKILIVRTWTVGAYDIGDLIWNRETYDRVFKDLTSKHLIVSHKYGETDFYRHLELNPLIFHGKQQKIVELQAKREYEGFGEYPSYIGYDYFEYYNQIKDHSNIIGIDVWCQGGGWSPYRRRAFLDKDAIWNELNTVATINIFKNNAQPQDAVSSFAKEKNIDTIALNRLLYLSHEVVTNVLYMPEVAKIKQYFRRVRLPPLLDIFWESVSVNSFLGAYLKLHSKNVLDLNKSKEFALTVFAEMQTISRKINLLPQDIDFQKETFLLICQARDYLSTGDKTIYNSLKKNIKEYEQKYPDGYKFSIAKNLNKSNTLSKILAHLLRDKSKYRTFDTLMNSHFTSLVIRLLLKLFSKFLPSFTKERAMGVETLFK